MLLAGEKDPDRRKALETINAQAFRAFEMLADLMLFAHPPAPQRSEIDVRELLTELLQQHQTAARVQGTCLSLGDLPADLPLLTADRTQIGTAIAAIIKNGLEALRTGGEIRISVVINSGDPAHLEFTVADNGPGIPPEIRRHLFDPFFSGREAGRGLGLGLCKAWRVAELHHGTLQVVSSPGNGARFTLRVPLQLRP
jgi:signal transduction histidine kinase